MGAANAEVVQAAGVAQGECAELLDGVVADAEVFANGQCGWGGFGQCGVGLGWGGVGWQRAVGSAIVGFVAATLHNTGNLLIVSGN